MADTNLQSWEHEFRMSAEADAYALLREHLRKRALPDDPKLLLEGTIEVVYAASAYANLDAQSFAAFLDMQRYDPSTAVDATYEFTFDLCGKAYGRVLFSAQAVGILDLADLYAHPWEDYEVCGYRSIYISRIDDVKLSSEELTRLEQAVTADLRFDFSEDELDLWFDEMSIEGSLLVTVQDHHEP